MTPQSATPPSLPTEIRCGFVYDDRPRAFWILSLSLFGFFEFSLRGRLMNIAECVEAPLAFTRKKLQVVVGIGKIRMSM